MTDSLRYFGILFDGYFRQHIAAFEAEKIDMLSLGMLSEADLTALGLPLGHRRRFQAYVEAGFG